MTADDMMQLVYLSIWGAVLVGYFLVARTTNLGTTLRHAVLWGLIFVGVAAGYGLWQNMTDRGPSVTGDGEIVLRAGSDRHFKLDLKVNGTPITFILDTGASDIVLSQDDAARVGLDPDSLPYLGQARTANGTVGLARVELAEVVLAEGGLEFRDLNVPAFVNEGELDVSLLGMGYLSRYARIAIEGERLILQR
ncbi:MAG: aspartyl protease family protein [Roseibaca calidilacus]|uniref:Aspartyl protease family protein n=1 Tax=Roseibaca calidilacus TaxID=1666912 RepID=A0A0P7VX25_9RHOB|nr:TIGR02281 family clan AA aspartic protease [Roseibaca calidilacus]KPP91718.1 MAG: aspartyl protease family protein [Roseibaca calidilacus]CUX82635.1 aspartyl protease family protein [Roseibaca calidilacus]